MKVKVGLAHIPHCWLLHFLLVVHSNQSSFQGAAVKQSSSQEVEERNYVDGKLNGKATVLYPDSSKEIRTYKDNKLTGPASLFAASGERIEFEYLDGVVHGPAKIKV